MGSRGMTFLQKVRFFYKNITVEPMLGWYIVSGAITYLAVQNLNLERACSVNLGYPAEVCTSLSQRQTIGLKEQEEKVQQAVATMYTWTTLLHSSVPIVMILFYGSWSDKHRRRKPFMLLPVWGDLFTSLGLVLCTYLYWLPMEIIGLTEIFLPMLTGQWITMSMAVFSFVGDISSVESRSLRIGIVNVFISVSVPVGTSLSGVLCKQIGFYGVFSVSAFLYFISVLYGHKGIQEVPQSSLQESSSSVWQNIKDFFDPSLARETVSVIFKEKDKSKTRKLILLMIVHLVVLGPFYGEFQVMYLYTRLKFNWDEVAFSIFSTYSLVTNLFGTAMSVGLFTYMLKIDDALIGVMSCMSKMLGGIIYAFASTTWLFYLAPLVEIINGTSFIAMRSVASKLVPSEELGKINSIFGMAEAVAPVVYGPLYTYLYGRTMDTMPGAFFLLGSALIFPAILIFLWMYFEHRIDNERSNQESKEGSTNNVSLKDLEKCSEINLY